MGRCTFKIPNGFPVDEALLRYVGGESGRCKFACCSGSLGDVWVFGEASV